MSLVSHYVQADDGNWYQDPVIGDPNLWFVCFDDDDPPELVIRFPEAKLPAILDEIPFRIVRASHSAGVSRQFNGRFYNARAYFLKQVGTIPASRIFKHGGMTHEQPRCQGVFTPAFASVQGKG